MTKQRQNNLATIGLRADDSNSDQMWADYLPASEAAACRDWQIMREATRTPRHLRGIYCPAMNID